MLICTTRTLELLYFSNKSCMHNGFYVNLFKNSLKKRFFTLVLERFFFKL